jgi:hypothetical protein
MTARKKVPPPPVLEQSDVLSQRFSTSVTPESHTSVTPYEAEGLPTPRAKRPAPKKTTRPAPPGMVRRSIYTREDALTALMDAADRVVAGTNGFTTKAEAIAELILSGVANESEVLAALRTRLQERLSR